MKQARINQLGYLFLAIIMIPMGIYLNYSDIVNGQFSEKIICFFLGTSALMISYLSPHLFPKDERTKEIIGKSMTANYFTLFAAITTLIIIVGNTLSATQVLTILFCTMVTSIPLSMIIYSKLI